ncbi:hypothetical protein [Cellulomonas xiejunii]|uniref:Uncharacterized protein n=1 Tax=Cellulomonas xiejunii TaxID=2968083 RepID=A0ABY5KSG4_9CELL|nr:hypothetical protein [Cellulomonas xiejunii]MCC2315570.1 hypothetical protein [Cellulomonas xiejunii]MCC2322646.1 hypothetical protein [Cellulomonas xiejunii]UUI72684.1 hypothetical protein NP048_04300 [Cellulomonas xiejunii]
MLDETWVEHRRSGDREVLGWVRPSGDGFVAVDRLGRDVTGPVDWTDAEDALDERGLHWLADLWQLTREDGTVLRVRIAEVSPERVVVCVDDKGEAAISAVARHELPFPAPASLVPFAGDPFTIDPDPAG